MRDRAEAQREATRLLRRYRGNRETAIHHAHTEMKLNRQVKAWRQANFWLTVLEQLEGRKSTELELELH